MTEAERNREYYAPYFHLSKNEFGKMWLMYDHESDGRYKCWHPINEKFWKEFEKLLNATAELKSAQELNRDLAGYVIAYKGLASLTSDEEAFIQSLINKAHGK